MHLRKYNVQCTLGNDSTSRLSDAVPIQVINVVISTFCEYLDRKLLMVSFITAPVTMLCDAILNNYYKAIYYVIIVHTKYLQSFIIM